MKSIYSTIKLNLNTGRRKTTKIIEDTSHVLDKIDLDMDDEEYSSIYSYLISKTISSVNETTDIKVIQEELDIKFPTTSAHKLGDAISLYFKYDDVLRKNIYIQTLYAYIITHTARLDVLYFALDVFTALYMSEENPLLDPEIFRVLSMYAPLTKMAETVYKNIYDCFDKIEFKKNYKHIPVAQDKLDNLKINREFVDNYLTVEHNSNSLRNKLTKTFKPGDLYSKDFNGEGKPYMKIEAASKLLSRLYYCEENDIPSFIGQIDAFFDQCREGKKNNATTLAENLLAIKGLDKKHLFKVSLEIFYRTTNVTVMNVALNLFFELPYYIFNSAFWSDVERMVYCNPIAAKALQLLSRNNNETKFILNIIRLGATNVTHCALKALVLQSKVPGFKLTRSDYDIIINKSWRRAIKKEECIIATIELYRVSARLKQDLMNEKELLLVKEYLTILVDTDSKHNITTVPSINLLLKRYIEKAKAKNIDITHIIKKSITLFSALTEEDMKDLTSFTPATKKKVLETLNSAL